MNQSDCRLCGAKTEHRFSLLVLKRFDVGYFRCTGCGSLQTETPYWLNDAYAFAGVNIDSGQALRLVQSWIRLNFILQEICFDKAANCLDFGGASGALARLMRDCGYQFLTYDKYSSAGFATYFDADDLTVAKPRLITAIEVFEHLPDPAETLNSLFVLQPDIILFTTVFYEEQGPDWDYLIPICGQHVFFYSQQALRELAENHGYEMMQVLGFWAMVSKSSPYLTPIKAVTRDTFTPLVLGQIVRNAGGPEGAAQRKRDNAYAMARFEEEVIHAAEAAQRRADLSN